MDKMMDKELPKISVIVPIYNCKNYLEKCLNSLAAQTYPNIEILLIDDGSTDGSGELAKKFSNEDSRFQYIYQTNSGVSAARNKGLALATGDFIGFCDSDDWVEPDMYECLVQLIKDTDTDIVCCNFFNEENGKSEWNIRDNGVVTLTCKEVIFDVVFNGKKCGGVEVWSKLFKREMLKQLAFDTNIALGEDTVFIFEAMLMCKKYVFTGLPKYHYVIRTESACHSSFKEANWSIFISSKKIQELMQEYYPERIELAQKYAINNAYTIVEKLANAHQLNKENYLRIKNEIKASVNPQSMSLFGKRRRLSVKIFLKGRRLFIVYRKLITQKWLNKVGMAVVNN
jgi:glycosyltransferase involved in cell wall biosynthesis